MGNHTKQGYKRLHTIIVHSARQILAFALLSTFSLTAYCTTNNYPWMYSVVVFDHPSCGQWSTLDSPAIYPTQQAAMDAGCRRRQGPESAIHHYVGAFLYADIHRGLYLCHYQNLNPSTGSNEVILSGGGPDDVCIPQFVNHPNCPNNQKFDIQTQACVPNSTPTMPGPGSPKNLGCDACNGGAAMTSHPINLGTGNKFLHETDYISSGLSPLRFIRYYNSGDAASHNFSDGWRDNYQRSITTIDSSTVQVTRTDGKQFSATLTGGIWQFDPDVHLTLNKTSSGWALTTKNDDIESYNNAGNLTQILSKKGRLTTLTYNANNLLTSVNDDLGNTLTINHDTLGRIDKITAPGGRSWTYTYSIAGILTSVTRPDGTVRSYQYENANFPGYVTGITDSRGIRFATFDYDNIGRTILSTLAGGVEKVNVTYNADNSRTVTNGRGYSTTFTMDTQLGEALVKTVIGPGCAACSTGDASFQNDPTNNNLLSETRNGITSHFGNYDANGNPGYKIAAPGTPQERRTDYTYDPRFHSRISSKTESSILSGKSKITTYSYDNYGNLLSKTINGYRADGTSVTRTTSYLYNGPLHQLSQINGPRTDVSDVTTLSYYPNDSSQGQNRARLQRVVDAAGHVLRDNIQYTVTGKIQSETRLNGVTENYSYYPGNDRLETLTETASDGTSRTARWTYLPTGEVASITLGDGTPAATTVYFTYDDAQRLTRISDDAGNYIQYTLDSEDNQLKKEEYDRSGTLKTALTQTFDTYNRLDATSGANANINYDFAPDGTLSQQTDGNNVVTRFNYDALKRLTTTAQDVTGIASASANTTINYSYDQHNDLTSVTDPNGNITTYTYDDLGEKTKQFSPDTGTSTYTYDTAGNLLSQTDAKGQTTRYQYDALNRLTLTTYADASTTRYAYDTAPNGLARLASSTGSGIQTRYEYDPFGDVTATHQTIGTSTLSLTRTYNSAGQLTTLTYPSGLQVSYTYTQGLLSDVQVNGTPLLSGITYQPFGPVSGWTWADGSASSRTYDLDGRLVSQSLAGDTRTLNYDPVGDITGITDSQASRTYGYDALMRLSAANDATHTWAYTYDANGNRTGLSDLNGNTTYSYAAASNRLQASSGAQAATYTLDADGNTVNDGTHRYAYDARNRLTTVDGGTTATYTYNAQGQRVEKTALQQTNGPDYAALATQAAQQAQGYHAAAQQARQ